MPTGPIGRGGRVLGQVEDGFLETLLPGDTFLFGGEILALQAIVDDEALCARVSGTEPKIPSYAGSKFPLSTYLAEQVRAMTSDPEAFDLPDQVEDWLALQKQKSALPPRDRMLVETFPRGGRHYLIAYAFEGRLAHQTLGMLLTRRMERAKLRPMGFVANDYAIAVWSHHDVGARIGRGLVTLEELFDEDMLGDDLESWLDESSMMKRTFRICATISGLIERRHPGREKTGRQMTVSTNLVYDVLRRTSPTTSCSRRRARMRRPDSWISGGSASYCRASEGGSCTCAPEDLTARRPDHAGDRSRARLRRGRGCGLGRRRGRPDRGSLRGR